MVQANADRGRMGNFGPEITDNGSEWFEWNCAAQMISSPDVFRLTHVKTKS